MDNGTSPEPNETEATNEAAPPVDEASDEATQEAQASGDDGAAADDGAAPANDERAAADDSASDAASDDVSDDDAANDEVAAASDDGARNPQTQAATAAASSHSMPAPPTAEKKWYIVHTYSGHENKAKLTLLERVKTHNLTDYFGDVLVPTETVTENVKGHRRTTNRKFFPGYMFVQMVLDDRTFHLVKNTPKITGFLGGMKPTPVPEREIHGVQSNVAEGAKGGKAKARVSFEAGEQVRVVDGPFANFSAKVEEVKADKQKLKVSLNMFGRTTSVELDFAQVEKA